MAEDNRRSLREIPKHDIRIKASTQERSLVKDLSKGVMEEVIVPQSKEAMRNVSTSIVDMFANALRTCIDRILYPDGNVPYKKSSSGNGVYTGVTNYTSFSRPIGNYQPQQKGRDMIGQRPGNEVKQIWVESEDHAKQIVGALREDIDNYGKVKVATLYEMIGERTTMADFKYGWTDSNSIGYYYDNDRRGTEFRWYIDLPKPVDIINN